MTQQETSKILALVQEAYPKFMDGRQPATTLNLWSQLFAEESYQQVEDALLAWIARDTKGFPPSIGQIKESLTQLNERDVMGELEAWTMVKRALRNGFYGFREEFAKLPMEIQLTLGDAKVLHEWSQMDEETVSSVIASNFQRSYRGKHQAIREMKKLPPSLRQMPNLPSRGNKALPGATTAVEAEINAFLTGFGG